MYEIVLNTATEEKRGAVLQNGKVTEWLVEPPSQGAREGDIFTGKVSRVLPGMEAAFVHIGTGKDGYLHMKEVRAAKGGDKPLTSCLKEGQTVLVQVTKEEMGTKGPRLSEYIQMPGQSIVYLPYSDYVAVSKRLGDDELRKEWREFARESVHDEEGIIIRTAAKEMGREQILREMDVLRTMFGDALSEAEEKKTPSLVFAGGSLVLQAARNYAHNPGTELICDNPKDVRFLKRWMSMNPAEQATVKQYTAREGIFAAYGLEQKLERVFQKRAWLKSGGFLIIEETEAMTVIDVNSGKYTGKKGLDDTAVKVNLEAAAAVAEELRLRDLGGIIMIDFIDMEDDTSRDAVLRTLKEALKKDRTKTSVAGFTSLGLVEMTRKKARSSVAERLLETCPSCSGTGQVKSAHSLYSALERELTALPSETEAVCISAGDSLAAFLKAGSNHRELEERTGKLVFFARKEGAGFEIRLTGNEKEVRRFFERGNER
ncbi:Rne/Rng family ribonuclease [Alteribacter natronophilus]|uniref:Rne/Rng family ribonuclease n=1 Tax=Alteribacter natronophilus TaxID=2583810 RepID=UPI00110EF306|nr:Rne/Rng family ribonuclease [Alteribacter natronophilus]TMW71566.1 Rne/Rng family ribonuclease [Alteribacter natronophilus]